MLTNNEVTLENKLKSAIHAREIVPYYQPIVDGITERISGVEILSRWLKDGNIVSSPDVFIPLAEKTGFLDRLTLSIMDQAKVDLLRLEKKLPEKFHISININPRQLAESSILDHVISLKNSFNKSNVKVTLEISEQAPLKIDKKISDNLHKLSQNNILIAIDDFGMGYSGLFALNELKVDIVKLDKYFTGIIGVNAKSNALIDGIIDMAKSLSLTVIAEGLETRSQIDYLLERNVKMLQGFFYFKPLAINDIQCLFL